MGQPNGSMTKTKVSSNDNLKKGKRGRGNKKGGR